MSITIFPESGDQITEAAWTTHNRALTVAPSYVVSGFSLSAGAGLNVSIALGDAVVYGFHINSDGTATEAVAASNTNYVFLNPDGTFTVNTTGTVPTNALQLGTATTDGSGVTAVSHQKNVTNAYNVYIRKPSDETVNNSTTLQDDDDLQFAVGAGESWEVLVLLQVTQTSQTPDIKFNWDYGAGTGSTYTTYWGANTATGGSLLNVGQAISTSFSIDHVLATGIPIVLRVLAFVTTAGTLKLQWAQNTATVADTKVLANSILLARRILG